MKKIIRLTEQDLATLLKGIVNLATGMATSNTNKKETTSNDKSTNTTSTNTTSTNSDSKETKSTGKKLPPNIQKLIDKYQVESVPTFVFIKDGEEIEKFSGANEKRLRESTQKLSDL